MASSNYKGLQTKGNIQVFLFMEADFLHFYKAAMLHVFSACSCILNFLNTKVLTCILPGLVVLCQISVMFVTDNLVLLFEGYGLIPICFMLKSSQKNLF